MRHPSRVKPASHPKAKHVLQTQALLEIVSLGNTDLAAGRIKPVEEVVARLRAKRGAPC